MMLQAAKAEEFGLALEGVKLDYAKVASRRDDIIQKLRGGIKGLLAGNKVELIQAAGSFKNAHTLSLEGAGNRTEVSADKIIIATGSKSVELSAAPFDHDLIIDSADAVTANEIPESIIIIGGGYIGIEFANIYSAWGLDVTVVEALDRLLPGIDEDCAKVIFKTLKKAGVKTHTGVRLEKVQTADGRVVARLADGTELGADQMLVCVGRIPSCDGLAVEKAGLEPGENGGLSVNKHMQTSVPHIYAIGDVAGDPLLAHVGSQEGLVAAAHAAGTLTAEMDYRVVPACVFSFPEIGIVGMGEESAAEVTDQVVVKKFPFIALGKAHIRGETDGFVKIIADGKTGEVLGVRICGPDASSLIGEAALALKLECTAEEIAETIHAHPTLPEAFREAADGVIGLPINWRG
jgi:dihydrolipoamide dehydrogenase